MTDVEKGFADNSDSNRGTDLPGYAAWQIHPVMRLNGSERQTGRMQRPVSWQIFKEPLVYFFIAPGVYFLVTLRKRQS
jgi:hypothetical protein